MVHAAQDSLRDCTDSINKMTGTVEAHEPFIGGKARNMHVGKRMESIRGCGRAAVVFRLLERETWKSTSVVSTRRKVELQCHIRENVAVGT